MSCLAIKGHVTRGKEVIEILEMLGGRNVRNYACDLTDYAYSINGQGIIDWYIPHPNSPLVIFTLEKFLEKYPYKVGDKVSSKCLKNYKIEKMEWEDTNNRVIYKLQEMGWYSPYELQPYKEETMEEEGTLVKIDLTREMCVADEVEVILGDYEFVLKDGKTYFAKKKPQYPKTYEECAQILLERASVRNDIGHKGDLLIALQRLLVCRDAYWKIAGEQMDLGKPWEPDWLNTEQDKFVLYTHNNVICLNRFVLGHNVLAFPTAEMRDAFLENFKELIESCKELL